LLAILAGINPAIIVRAILIATKIPPAATGNVAATPLTPESAAIKLLIGMHKRTVIPIPSAPATNPTISVSALNTLEISFLDAPILRKIPISFTYYICICYNIFFNS